MTANQAAAPELSLDAAGGYQRRIYLIDPKFQMEEVNWTITAFAALMAVQAISFAVIGILFHRDMIDEIVATVALTVTAFLAPVLLCAVFARHAIRRSHRVAGAAYRLTQDAKYMIDRPAFRFHLREGDYLWHLATELNRVMAVLEARDRSLHDLEARLEELDHALEDLAQHLDEEDATRIRRRVRQIGQIAFDLRGTHPAAPCDSEEEAVGVLLGEAAENEDNASRA